MTLPDVDRICVVIGRTRHGMMQAEIQEAARQGAHFLELRLDFLKKAPDFKRLLENKPCPMLATVRRPPDGGKWDQGEDARRMILRQAIVAGFDWVDLEADIADSIPRFGSVKRIVSYHNFREMPADLEKIHERMCAQDADVVKVVVRAGHVNDNLRILELVKKGKKPTVAFCMGDLGFPSRILQGKYGAPFTYAAFNKERNIAPGMPSFTEVKQVYHFYSLNAQTAVYGVIGDPIAHSLSPMIHNAAFRKLGLNAVYLPFRVPRETLPDFLRGFDQVPVSGYSVTIPQKEAAAAAAAVKDETVERTSAANTLVRDAAGAFTAYNTDYDGFLQSLREYLPTFHSPPADSSPEIIPPAAITGRVHLPPGALSAPAPQPGHEGITTTAHSPASPVGGEEPPSGSVANRVALVLGAGGIARAVAHALHREGALVTICNRTPDRAQTLAHEVGCRHVEWKARHGVLCDLVVNCTSVGMHPNVDEMPLHPSYLKPGLIVFDTVYTPEQTLLVKEARDRGCHVITGVELFVRQAARQFELFTGERAPIDLFRQVVRRILSPVTIREEA